MNAFRRMAPFLAIAVLGSAMSSPPANAAPMIIPAGYDLFQTIAGSPTGTDGTWLAISVPSGFFGTYNGLPSDPFSGLIPYEGDPTGPEGHTFPAGFELVDKVAEATAMAHHLARDPRNGGGLSDTDTIVQRTQDVTLPTTGGTGTTGLQIQSLGLRTVTPFDVSYGGGAFNSLFDGTATLDPSVTQPMGSMTLTRTSDTGGTFDSLLPVIPYLTFVPEDPLVQGAPGPFDAPEQDFTSTDTAFTTVPEPGALPLAAALLIGAAGAARRRRNCRAKAIRGR